MSPLLENLRMDHKCLLRMVEQAGFAGEETGIRVRDPQMLSDALGKGIKEIERLQLAVDQWRQEVGKKASQIGRLSDENKRLREALDECEDYFDQRADAEYFPDSAAPHPNEEMKLLQVVREAIRKAGA